MTLPYDIARCNGVGFEDEGTGVWYWRNGCEDCRRREPGDPGAQWFMNPPKVIAFECAFRIEPEASNGWPTTS